MVKYEKKFKPKSSRKKDLTNYLKPGILKNAQEMFCKRNQKIFN